MSEIKVSIVMPAYNAQKYLQQAIDSVLNQTYGQFELILVDDCSTDQTPSIAQGYIQKDPRVRYIKNEQNKGVSHSRNRAIDEARYDWIAFLDSDDMWREDKLQKQVEFINTHKDVSLVYTGSSFIREDGTASGYYLGAAPKMTYRELLKKNLLSCSSVMVKKELISKVKMAHDQMHEDYTAWLLIMRNGVAAYGIDEPLLIYRVSKQSKSGSRLKSANMLYRSYRYIGYSPLKAGMLTARYSLHSISKHYRINRQEMEK